MMNTQAVVHIRKGEARSLKAGGMWIYDNEIERIEGEFENGDILRVEDFDGYPLGCGFINTRSKLTVRMLSRKKDTVIDDAFIEMRVRNAWEYRRQTVDTSSCRLIFGEADFLPGIVIDKFSDVLVVESLALGIDRLKPLILEKLVKVLEEDGIHIRGIYERSDAKVRLQEGMERYKGFIGEPFDTKVEIVENGVRYLVDVKDGQKTGFFLDQKYNRLAIQRLCPGKRVLDCFTHMGTFALNAGIAGATEVTGLDISGYAVEQARENARRNGLEDTVQFRCANVLDELPKLAGQVQLTTGKAEVGYDEKKRDMVFSFVRHENDAEGREVLERVIADLDSRGHSSLSLKEDGSVCVHEDDDTKDIPQEHLTAFPPKVYWPRLGQVLESEGLSARVQDHEIAVSW